MGSDIVSLAGALLTLCCVLLLAYWCSRFLGKGWMRASSGRNLKVIEQLRLGTDKQLLLLKVKEHTYLIGVSQAGIQLLKEVEGEFDEISQAGDESVPFSFQEALRQYVARYGKKEKKDE